MTANAHTTASPEGLAAQLTATGALDRQWRRAFEAVPRHWFVPDVIWPGKFQGTGQASAIDRRSHPDAWWDAVYSDRALTTQWDDGEHTGPEPGKVPSCSSSMPTMVAGMLDDLDLQPGMRVLEIGTGEGWNTALLCHRTGEANVTTVETDPVLAERARTRLRERGLTPTCITGDGSLGHPERAPFGRIIATCSLARIPTQWLGQARPGSVIVAPWAPDYGSEAIVRLSVTDGGNAHGRFTRSSAFMRLRQQRRRSRPLREYLGGREWPADATRGTTRLSPDEIGPWERMFALGVQLPGVFVWPERHKDDTYRLWLRDKEVTSWASADFAPGRDEFDIAQSGPRRLWEEVEAAYRWWTRQGRPGIERFGLTVAGEHRVWLGDPSQPVPQWCSTSDDWTAPCDDGA
ncbi:rRNA adenine N-6-methyltransferase family protein [Streptomyces sp. NPDC054796]